MVRRADLLVLQNIFFWISMILGLSIVWIAVPESCLENDANVDLDVCSLRARMMSDPKLVGQLFGNGVHGASV